MASEDVNPSSPAPADGEHSLDLSQVSVQDIHIARPFNEWYKKYAARMTLHERRECEYLIERLHPTSVPSQHRLYKDYIRRNSRDFIWPVFVVFRQIYGKDTIKNGNLPQLICERYGKLFDVWESEYPGPPPQRPADWPPLGKKWVASSLRHRRFTRRSLWNETVPQLAQDQAAEESQCSDVDTEGASVTEVKAEFSENDSEENPEETPEEVSEERIFSARTNANIRAFEARLAQLEQTRSSDHESLEELQRQNIVLSHRMGRLKQRYETQLEAQARDFEKQLQEQRETLVQDSRREAQSVISEFSENVLAKQNSAMREAIRELVGSEGEASN